MKQSFYLLDIDYITINEEPVIRLFGATENNKKIIVHDNSFKPYFYILLDEKNLKKVMDIIEGFEKGDAKVLSTQVIKRNYLEKEATGIKVTVNHPKAISYVVNAVSKLKTLGCKEIDIKFVQRYLIDKDLTPLAYLEANGEEVKEHGYNCDLVIKAESVKKIDEREFTPKVLVFDIEVYNFRGRIKPEKDKVLMISIRTNYGKTKRLLTTKECKNPPEYVEVFANEKEMLQEFINSIKASPPDFIVTYNGESFDFPYLQERAKKNKLKLDIGLDSSKIKIRNDTAPSAKIKGIQHIDLFTFISTILYSSIKSERLDLNSVASELLGKNKVDINGIDFWKEWDGANTLKLCKYSMTDAEITYELYEKLIPLLTELTKLVKNTPYEVSRSPYSKLVESYLIRKAFELNEIAPNKPKREIVFERRTKKFEGAFVYEPKPGIYEGIAVVDFKSLYPSIIVSKNISPGTISSKEQRGGNAIEFGGEKYYFSTQKQGFFPRVLNELIKTRSEIKKKLKERKDAVLNARSNALKTITNASYGYLGFPNARWYSFECGAAITAYGRKYIKETIKKSEDAGFDVIYGDTDSTFLSMKGKTKENVIQFLEKINKELPEPMALELDKFFVKGIFVSKRGAVSGAKKKYALIDEEGELTIKGFAFVRRDWARIAKKTQEEVFKAILKENSLEKAKTVVKKIISDLRNHKVPLADLLINVQLKKGINEYKTKSPHVIVAERMIKQGLPLEPGMIIQYVITKGSESISQRARTPEEVKEQKLEYDEDYYIDNQVIPSIQTIFEALGFSEIDLKSEGQKYLSEY